MRTTGARQLAIDALRHRRQLARDLGGEQAIERQRARGLLTPYERIDLLLDPGTNLEFGTLVHSDALEDAERTLGDGELAGFGEIGGRPVAYLCADPRVKGASGGPGSMKHSDYFRHIVEKAALPLIHLHQGGGARITDVITSAFAAAPGAGLGARRAFPRRGALLTAALGNYYAPWTVVQSDFCVMTKRSNFSLTAPGVIEIATGQRVTEEELGGWEVRSKISGEIDAVTEDDAEAIALLRKAFGYLPANAFEDAPVVDVGDPPDRLVPELETLVPEAPNRAYDVRRVITAIVDRDSFLEYAPTFARNIAGGLARIAGRTVVIFANQPMILAGAIDVPAILKIKRLLTLSEDLGLPAISLLDTPGALPTKEQEHNRLMALLYDMSVVRVRADVPKIAIVMRKGIGFALFAMSACDPEGFTFAWPSAQIAFIGAEPGARIAFRKPIEEADDPKQKLEELAAGFRGVAAPYIGAQRAYNIDDVIEPADTRTVIARALEASRVRPARRRRS
jgi:acetyl-CoA carboxylase carboxyltransferase component